MVYSIRMDRAEADEIIAFYAEQRRKVQMVDSILDTVSLKPPFDYLNLGSQVGPSPTYDVLLTCYWTNADMFREGQTSTFRTVAQVEDTSEEAVLSLARDLLRASLHHELDECFRVNGAMIFDPHMNDPEERAAFILEREP